MNFKQIELHGFKSFADKTEIKFDSGITAIVGPNGCGKSNVADAVRWVLGEQSSKMLRGTSMQDVIFNGTEKRKSLSYSEVSLTFNNQDRYFNVDADEICITRKLYRSGESAYLINRTPARLKDITNILYDSGMGKDGYSIIGQGKVEEIISSKPEDRRNIFEDAAGIAKFKARKKTAESNLERTRENLQRANDILFELERQMGPLKKQAENAKLWLGFRDRLQDLEVNVYVYRYDNASDVKSKITTRLNALSEEIESKQETLAKTNEDYNQSMTKVNEIDGEIAFSHERILELTVDLEKQSGHLNVIRERISNLSLSKSKIENDLIASKNIVESSTAKLDIKSNQNSQITQTLMKLNNEYESKSNEYLKIVDELSLHEGETNSNQQKIIDVIGRLTEIKANYSKYKTQVDFMKQSLEETKQKLVVVDDNYESKKCLVNELESVINAQKAQILELNSKLQSAKMEQESLSNKIKESHEMKFRISSELRACDDKKSMLEEMQKEYDGYQYAIKKLLKESQTNSNIKSKIVGVLASLISVPQKYETAVEVALGNALQNIVTKDENDAKSLISYLKQNAFGRATFLPITKIKSKDLYHDDKAVLKTSGCFGVASELISFGTNLKDIMSNLLGTTIIVDNLETAIAISNKTKLNYKIVTLDGDVINPMGSMTGGSRKQEISNLISRDREIVSLAESIVKLKKQLDDETANVEKFTSRFEEVKVEVNKCFEQKNNLDVEFATGNEKLESTRLQKSQVEEERNSLNDQKNNLESKIEVLTKELESIDQLESDEVENRESASNFISSRQEKFENLKQEKEVVSEQLTRVKVEIASMQAEQNAVMVEIDRLKEDIRINNVMAESFQTELTQIEKTIFDAEKVISSQIETDGNKEAKKKLDTLKQQMSNFEIQKVELNTKIKVLDQEKMQIVEYISSLNDKKNNSINQLEKVDTELEQMQERIFEEYALTYDICAQYVRPDFNIDEAMPEIAALKKDIHKLGFVNVHAIEDVKLISERYDNLKEQTDDLMKAEENLTKVIDELSVEMTARFKEQFNKINDNFKVTFKELFGGGNAKLVLTDPDNLLESGVEIIAEPPGKKLQSITLLSGGEKALTAIAILFAILKLKPMPFCLLDEIEAALDDSNVGRFAEYLHRFSKVTQFIVITHRKPTMELADCLYGVTMEEKGVSKMVSVQLKDAISNVEEN